MESVIGLEPFLRLFSSFFVNREAARTNKTVLLLLSVHRSEPGRYKKVSSASSEEKKSARGRKLESPSLQKISTRFNSQSNMVFLSLEEICLNLN